MTSRFALLFTFIQVINFTPSARSQAIIDSAAVLSAAFSEIGPLLLFNKSYFLAMDRWPESLVDIDGYASKNDSLSSSWSLVRKKLSSVKFVIARGDTLAVYFELAPFTQDSLVVDRARGIMKMLPGPPDRPGCMIVAIEFTDIAVLNGSRQPTKR